MRKEYLPQDVKRKLWKEVIEKGQKQEPRKLGLEHKLSPDEVLTIVATAEALGCNDAFVSQLLHDLTVPKYRLFDEIGMLLTDRYKGYGETPEELKNAEKFVRILAELYVKEDIEGLIKDLRTVDYLFEGALETLIERKRKKLESVL